MKKQKKSNLSETELGLKILKDLRRITRAMDINSKRLSMEGNLTSPQIHSLGVIHKHGPLTIAEIATAVHLSASTMVGIIDRLEAKNLVIRERSRTDRRQVLVYITEEGQIISKKSPIPLQEKLVKSFSRLTGAERKNLSKALELLADTLDSNES